MNSPVNQPDEEQPSPELSASHETRLRKFCRIGRAFCWVVGVALVLAALASPIMGVIAFRSAPATKNSPLQKGASAYDPALVGKTLKKFYFEFGAAYEWPFPRFVVWHESSSTLTGVDKDLNSNAFRNSIQTAYAIQSHNFGKALTERPPRDSDDGEDGLMKLVYPGLAHALDTTAKGWDSRGFVVTDTLLVLIWCGLGIILVTRFHRLFSHCSQASALDRSAIAIYRQLLVVYTAILVFGPLSFYLTNLVISGGVSHILRIPYAGLSILLLLSCLYWLINKTSHLQDEVNATI